MSIKVICPHCSKQIKELFGSLENIWKSTFSTIAPSNDGSLDDLLSQQPPGTELCLNFDDTHLEDCNRGYRMIFSCSISEDGTRLPTELKVIAL